MTEPSMTIRALRPFLAGAFAAGAILLAGLFLAHRAGVMRVGVQQVQRDGLPAVSEKDQEVARQVMAELTDVVGLTRDRLEAGALTEPAGTFVILQKAFPEIYQRLSTQARRNVLISVRAEQAGFKIFVQSGICPLAVAETTMRPDPVREIDYKGFCFRFGTWNEGGKDF